MNQQKWSDNKNLTVINMFGGPGCGKTTTAAFLFGAMKAQNKKVEFVHEVAKDYVWEHWDHIFSEQDWIFAHQHRLIRRLIGHDIDYAVVDSSILLGLFYMPDDFPQSFRPFIRSVYDTYDNINIFIDRNEAFPYVQTGRNQTEQQSLKLDDDINRYFVENNLPMYHVLAGPTAVDQCLEVIKTHDNSKK